MAMDGQALPRVEQLDQQGRVRPKPVGMGRSKVCAGVSLDGLPEGPPVFEPGQTCAGGLATEEAGSRADPVFGKVVAAFREGAEFGDRGPAPIEAGWLVGSQADRFQASSAIDNAAVTASILANARVAPELEA
jgi:hypothetical protein